MERRFELRKEQWDHQPLLAELVRQVGQRLGRPNGVLVLDPSGFAKSGKESVGVARQWCGRLGKVDNCQVGIYMGYASEVEHALVDVRLYLPKEWVKDDRRREKGPLQVGIVARRVQARDGTKAHGSITGNGITACRH